MQKSSSRTYAQFCPLARGLDLLGERWTLLVIRELMLGPRRYGDLHAALRGIGTNLLAARLQRLEEAGVVQRVKLPPPAGSTVYELTDRGRELEGPILALARWGAALLDEPRPGEAFDPGWLLLSLRAMFRPEEAEGVRETYEFRIGGDRLHVRVSDGRIEAAVGPAPSPDLVIETDPKGFLALASGAVEPQAAVGQGLVRIEGELDALERSLRIMGPPRAA